jgi:hypothetical protein
MAQIGCVSSLSDGRRHGFTIDLKSIPADHRRRGGHDDIPITE